jgi:hypothetical protein
MPGILDDLPEKSEFDRAREKAGDLSAPNYVRASDGLPAIAPNPMVEAAPATEEYLCCMAGCRHYCEVLADSDDVTTTGPMRELRRYCVRLQAGNELMEIGDAAVLACSFFRPRWWSSTAWRTWRRSKRRLKEYRDALAARDMARDGGEDGTARSDGD